MTVEEGEPTQFAVVLWVSVYIELMPATADDWPAHGEVEPHQVFVLLQRQLLRLISFYRFGKSGFCGCNWYAIFWSQVCAPPE